ncbi:hypothetical protein [Burkholderia ubonensis]
MTIVFDGPLEPAFSSLTVSNSPGKCSSLRSKPAELEIDAVSCSK